MIVLFFAGWPVPKVAVVAGALLLLTRRVKPEKVYREIDWSLLVMFIGLFIVVAGIEKTSVPADLFAVGRPLPSGPHGPAEYLRRAAFEPGEQCPRRAGVQAVHSPPGGPGARLADACHVLHPGGQPDSARHRSPT